MLKRFPLTLAPFARCGPGRARELPLDPYHTYPNFAVEHWGLSMMHGQFEKNSGKFSFDRAAKTGQAETDQ
jgi:polyisoprenoid-binding protein YceI